MAKLPEDRLTPNEPPFTHVAVDYFEPIEVKQGRSRVKRWSLLINMLNCPCHTCGSRTQPEYRLHD